MENSISLLMPSGSVFKRIPKSEVDPDQLYYELRHEHVLWGVVPVGNDFKAVTNKVVSFLVFKRISDNEFSYEHTRTEPNSSIRNP